MSVFSAFYKRVEEQIQEAMEKGQFDNLPGKGQPLPPDDAAHIAPELRMAYRILKRSGFPPEEILMVRKIESLQQMLLADNMTEAEREALKKKIMLADTELNMKMERFRKQYGGV